MTFFEEDEPLPEVMRAWDAGERGYTAAPATVGVAFDLRPDGSGRGRCSCACGGYMTEWRPWNTLAQLDSEQEMAEHRRGCGEVGKAP